MLSRLKSRLRAKRPAEGQWSRLEREGVVQAGRGTYDLAAVAVREYRLADGTWLGARLRIGAYCSIAHCTIFLGGNHRSDWVSQFPLLTMSGSAGAESEAVTKGDVRIGNDVWIGHGSTIMSGVTIGDGAVIGAGAVVAKDVRPYAVVVGNPAREVSRRFDDTTVDRLLALRWWDWPEERVQENLSLLTKSPTPELLDAASGGDQSAT